MFFTIFAKNIENCNRGDIQSCRFTLTNKSVISSGNDGVIGEYEFVYGHLSTAPTTGSAEFSINVNPNDEIEAKFEIYDLEPAFKVMVTLTYEAEYRENDFIYGAGSRVQEIVDYTINGTENNRRSFYYNELSKHPSLESSLDSYYLSSSLERFDYIRESSYMVWIPMSNHMSGGIYEKRVLYYINPYPLGYMYANRSQRASYKSITEFIGNKTSGNGAIERTYKEFNNYKGINWVNGPPLFNNPPMSNIGEGFYGKPEQEKIYKDISSKYILSNKKNYKYDLLKEQVFNNYIIECMDESFYLDKDYEKISIAKYKNNIQTYKLVQTIDSTFNDNGVLVNESAYTYSPSPYFNLKKQIGSTSQGKKTAIYYYYPNDLFGQMPNMDKLIAANRVGFPILEEKKIVETNGTEKIITANKKEFGVFGVNNVLNIRSLYLKNGGQDFEKQLSCDLYDTKGNLLQYVGLDNVKIYYIWSYNGQYPIAEIKSSSYTYSQIETTVKSVLGVTSIDVLSNSAPNGTIESTLKDGGLQKALPNALVTTYTYRPLVGMSSMTDPRGYTTYYDYDLFGRLKETYFYENGVKKILQTYDYHYHNQ